MHHVSLCVEFRCSVYARMRKYGHGDIVLNRVHMYAIVYGKAYVYQ